MAEAAQGIHNLATEGVQSILDGESYNCEDNTSSVYRSP